MDMDSGFAYTRRMLSLCERLCEHIVRQKCNYNSYVSGLASLAYLFINYKDLQVRNGANNIRTGAVKLQG